MLKNLKSNMDRFIENDWTGIQDNRNDLKSNMDRFIVIDIVRYTIRIIYLKSNMDRFIGLAWPAVEKWNRI